MAANGWYGVDPYEEALLNNEERQSMRYQRLSFLVRFSCSSVTLYEELIVEYALAMYIVAGGKAQPSLSVTGLSPTTAAATRARIAAWALPPLRSA